MDYTTGDDGIYETDGRFEIWVDWDEDCAIGETSCFMIKNGLVSFVDVYRQKKHIPLTKISTIREYTNGPIH